LNDFCLKIILKGKHMTSNITKIPYRSEVIVIGSGFAGLTAAIECRMNGGQVIVLEKMKAIGGNSIISDGGIAAPNTPEQELLGIHDSAAMMFEDMMRSAEGLNDPEITRIICEKANEAYQWSKDIIGINYMPRVDIFGGHQVPRCYTPDPFSGSTIILKMREKCEALGIKIFCGVSVLSFIQDEHKRVIGLNIDSNYSLDPDHKKELQQIYASKGIIIASGGYAADVSFRKQIHSNIDDEIQTTNKRFTSAEVLQACMDINAKTSNLDLIQWMPWTTNDETGYGRGGLFGDYIVSSYGILVDTKTGQRFINEQGNRKELAEKILEVKDVVGIADERSVKVSGWDLSGALQKGIIKKHESISDLTDRYKIPEVQLKETLYHYNQMVISKKDEQFNKPVEDWMSTLSAPFYSMRINPETHYSLGGVVTNVDTQVLDQQGHILQGLYAIGEVTGLTHGANRLGSCSVTECLVMGRIAGKKVIEGVN
jgi:flavocytochrome c